jgi:hypothetical protein
MLTGEAACALRLSLSTDDLKWPLPLFGHHLRKQALALSDTMMSVIAILRHLYQRAGIIGTCEMARPDAGEVSRS